MEIQDFCVALLTITCRYGDNYGKYLSVHAVSLDWLGPAVRSTYATSQYGPVILANVLEKQQPGVESKRENQDRSSCKANGKTAHHGSTSVCTDCCIALHGDGLSTYVSVLIKVEVRLPESGDGFQDGRICRSYGLALIQEELPNVLTTIPLIDRSCNDCQDPNVSGSHLLKVCVCACLLDQVSSIGVVLAPQLACDKRHGTTICVALPVAFAQHTPARPRWTGQSPFHVGI